ncbi:COX5B-domain-containing protein [Ascodesmis nigricans]|uniref:Cytochrome c oxidase subunit 4, mitochondrial n=1 Tax=Ascodesmis nigricans TaxID=341454 RepID=A0A4S2MZF2_9PEZI|nr:COX5B-domain-containing protein [Ascodesmis nigricans]
MIMVNCLEIAMDVVAVGGVLICENDLSHTTSSSQSTTHALDIAIDEIKTQSDLIGPGSAPGTIPTDIEQATGLERLEILGKMEGIDVFDMTPLDASRKGTLDNPITVESFGEERYLGCTGYPADSHTTIWLTVSKGRPIERCPECGSVYKMDYIGPEEDAHAHEHHDHGEPHFPPQKDVETLADYVKPQYW